MNREIQPLFEVDATKVAVGTTPDPEVAVLPKRQQFIDRGVAYARATQGIG
jgi:hypothetical protein